jgi:hypothetical protein
MIICDVVWEDCDSGSFRQNMIIKGKIILFFSKSIFSSFAILNVHHASERDIPFPSRNLYLLLKNGAQR